MDEKSRESVCDAVREMRGLAATLLAASRGDLENPARIIEYAAGQVERLAKVIADSI